MLGFGFFFPISLLGYTCITHPSNTREIKSPGKIDGPKKPKSSPSLLALAGLNPSTARQNPGTAFTTDRADMQNIPKEKKLK